MRIHKALYMLVAFVFLIFTKACETTHSQEAITSALRTANRNPTVYRFKNNLEVNNQGGHLQGVQLYSTHKGKFALLSGSSNSYSYYAVVKLGERNEVISVNKLMDKPYKHAGGFQVFQDYMAIGIEDNDDKDKSRVCVYKITDPENPPTKPISVIERNGEALRSTAGCVGITKYIDEALVVVGDWDTKHLDFYSCRFDELESKGLELFFTIDTEEINKRDWVDNEWISYQNINLITLNNNQLYLIGLGQNNQQQNIADLYSLASDRSGDFNLVKIASEIFDCTNETSFRNGAGVKWTDDGKLQIVSCGSHMERNSFLNCFPH